MNKANLSNALINREVIDKEICGESNALNSSLIPLPSSLLKRGEYEYNN